MHLSKMRKAYIYRLIFRVIIFIACAASAALNSDVFNVLHGWNFFGSFSPLHLLWALWMFDMACQIFPIHADIALGSQKLFSFRFLGAKDRINAAALKKYITDTTKAAYKVFLIWFLVIAALFILRWKKLISDAMIFLITVFFYVCDLVCVVIWCPFRAIMGNKCCTTCRIFNWDHLMMFSPLAALGGFFSASLVAAAFIVWLVWEICVFLYPERFWEGGNEALRCKNCSDRLCGKRT